jgi:hypothetical protein
VCKNLERLAGKMACDSTSGVMTASETLTGGLPPVLRTIFQPMNMNKEYRAELRTLKKAERKLWRDCKAAVRDFNREIAALEKRKDRAVRNTHTAVAKIDRRAAILEGRLA